MGAAHLPIGELTALDDPFHEEGQPELSRVPRRDVVPAASTVFFSISG